MEASSSLWHTQQNLQYAQGSVSGLYLPSASWRNYNQAYQGQDRCDKEVPSFAVAIPHGT